MKNLDKCMTNVDDGTCTASYGSSLVKDGSKGIVAYVKQLSEYLHSLHSRGYC